MAISFVASLPTVGAANGGSVTLTFSNFRDTANAAVTLLEGDIVVAAYVVGNAADAAMSTSSSGWTEVGELYSNGSTNDANLAVYWKVMGASPDTSIVLVGPGGAANSTVGTAFVFRGTHQTTPLSVVTPTTATGTATPRPDPAQITPTTSGSWIIVAAGGAAAATTVYTNSDLSATTNHFRTGVQADTIDSVVGIGIKTDWASGAFNPAAWLGGAVTPAAGDSWAAYTLVLEPAPAVTHASTGALTGPGSTIAGTAARFRAHTSTGALAGPGSQVAGSSARTGPAVTHTSTGALTGQGSALSGSASRFRAHTSSGALAGAGAVLAGVAARFRAHTSSGSLSGPGSTVTGAAARSGGATVHASSGALTGPGSQVAGSSLLTAVAVAVQPSISVFKRVANFRRFYSSRRR